MPVVTGRYSKYLKRRLSEVVEAAGREADLGDELHLSREMTERLLISLAKFEAAGDGSIGKRLITVQVLKSLMDVTRKLAESLTRIEESKSVTPEQVSSVVTMLLNILRRHIGDDVLRRVAHDLRNLRWPAGVDVVVVDSSSEDRVSRESRRGRAALAGMVGQ